MMKNITHCLWQATPARSLLECNLFGLALLALSMPMLNIVDPTAFTLFFVMLALLSAVWVAIRMMPFEGARLNCVLKECSVAIIFNITLIVFISSILYLSGNLSLLDRGYGNTMGMMLLSWIPAPAYLFLRTGFQFWRYWEILRRQRFMWSLIDAILKIIAVSGAVILLPLTLLFVVSAPGDATGNPSASFFAWLLVSIFMFLTIYAFVLLAGTVLFLPPAVLVAYLSARKLTRRLDHLTAATRALSNGNLDRRVAVEGDDEIAQLQTAFNRMAEQNQKFTSDLEAEKEKVTSILTAHKQMVADISHELRNPAAVIAGYSTSLVENWQKQEASTVTHDLKIISHEARRLQIILNDLLDAAQIETGRLSLNMQAVDTVPLANAVIETFSSSAWMGKRVQVSLSTTDEAVWVYADATRLEQVLVNLVQNAIQHTSPGGLVAVDISRSQHTIDIQVEDTGDGIPPEDIPHIWDRFYRSKAGKTSGRHAGLGLALVKELTEAMGGNVSLESQPGNGSRFTVHLSPPVLLSK